MARVMGQHANTPEKQALAKEVVATVVAQSPDLQVASWAVPEHKKGQLSLSSHTHAIHRPEANPGGRPKTGKQGVTSTRILRLF